MQMRRTPRDRRNPHRKKVGETVEDLRKWVETVDIAYTDLCKIAHLTRPTLYRFVDGGNATMVTLNKLAKARDLLEERMRRKPKEKG